MTVLAKARLGSCGHRPRPLSTLAGSRLKVCWGGSRQVSPGPGRGHLWSLPNLHLTQGTQRTIWKQDPHFLRQD